MNEVTALEPAKIDAFWAAKYATDNNPSTGLMPPNALQADFHSASGNFVLYTFIIDRM